jgi:hypothetical protein
MVRREGRPSSSQVNRSSMPPSSTIHKRQSGSKLIQALHAYADDVVMQDSTRTGHSSALQRRGRRVPQLFHKSASSLEQSMVSGSDLSGFIHRGPVPTIVEIANLPDNPSPKELLSLLKLKCQKPFHLLAKIQFSPSTNSCFLKVKNKSQALALQAISGLVMQAKNVFIYITLYFYTNFCSWILKFSLKTQCFRSLTIVWTPRC